VSYASVRGAEGLFAEHGDSRGRIAETEVELTQQLARGAFGTVWAGRWADGSGPVAVKVLGNLAVDSDGDSLDSFAQVDFENECAMLRLLAHPNLLRFFGFGVNGKGQGFIVTELMGRGSLRQVLHDKELPLSWPRRTSIALQLALGMQHLHGIPIVHRDLKVCRQSTVQYSRCLVLQSPCA
jgi:serine/threonine protein kinase